MAAGKVVAAAGMQVPTLVGAATNSRRVTFVPAALSANFLCVGWRGTAVLAAMVVT